MLGLSDEVLENLKDTYGDLTGSVYGTIPTGDIDEAEIREILSSSADYMDVSLVTRSFTYSRNALHVYFPDPSKFVDVVKTTILIMRKLNISRIVPFKAYNGNTPYYIFVSAEYDNLKSIDDLVQFFIDDVNKWHTGDDHT